MARLPKRRPRFLTVKSAVPLSPNFIRVTFAGPELEGFPKGHHGANCKLVLPREGESRDAFEAYFAPDGPGEKIHPVRTYTVRAYREDVLELDIDFVAHGDVGPATRWAQAARPGSLPRNVGPGSRRST